MRLRFATEINENIRTVREFPITEELKGGITQHLRIFGDCFIDFVESGLDILRLTGDREARSVSVKLYEAVIVSKRCKGKSSAHTMLICVT